MHHSEINHDMGIYRVDADLRGDAIYGDRPILLGYLAEVDGTDILVPESELKDSGFAAFTLKQGEEAFKVLAIQLGLDRAADLLCALKGQQVSGEAEW